jgi:uncharacterized protein
MTVEKPARRRTRWRRLALALGVVILLVNVIAYRQAYGLTHFAPPGGPQPARSWLGLAGAIFSGVTLPRPVNSVTPGQLGLPFTTLRIPGPNGETIEAWHVAAETPRGLVILFHGHGGAKAALLREAAAFRAMGFDALLIDFRGSGGSDGSVTTIGLREADDVAAACAFARERWPGRRLVLFGQSMGAAAILRAVGVLGERADALVLECPFDRLLSAVANRCTALGFPAFPMARLMVFWGGVQHGFNGFAHNPADYAAGVTCPVLLLHGAKDRLVKAEEADAIYQRLAGPKRFVTFEGAGHQAYLSVDAGLWKETVRKFLDESLD